MTNISAPAIISRADVPPLYEHQEQNVQFKLTHPRMIDGSDPGTGKSRTCLEAFARLKAANQVDRMLVLAPLSILRPSWGKDCTEFTPQLTYSVVTAKEKFKALPPAVDADIYVTNHDAVKWLKDWRPPAGERWVLVIDEAPAFKNRTSQRSKALAHLRQYFEWRWPMSGTLNANGVLDTWHIAFLTDDGERLGRQFWGFRAQVCTPVATGPGGQYTEWQEKPHARAIVADRLKDIVFRVKFEDCLDVPENVTRHLEVELPPRMMAQYRQLLREAAVEHESGAMITAIHAGAKAQKLLQLCSGAIYDGEGGYKVFDTSRTDLALDLIEQREQSVCAFLWKHQRDLLVEGARQRGLRYGVIDGETPVKEREVLVARFQAGDLNVIFAHPQSAAHGLTLTRGTATIWPSPTSNADHFQQFNRRIYRAGQKQRTETICISAADTREKQVYERLDGKLVKMAELNSLLIGLTTPTIH
ncbi:MAG: hypothetical protein JL55_18660 [Pseudomonas sp. BICA1-14]|nr:DEAD/DEAH box helicase [[Pseudomonas] sp. BICA1-14]KJS76197.1 MAG: hypothetical protein JL55_18660 [[Pseudomonas] sp. BICA1-14]HBW09410.1 ATP-dependent helicase [Pseudomonas sp.]